MPHKSYYAVLGVPQSASQDELRNAYRSLAKRYHPDAAPDNPYAAAHFAEISTAYEVLSSPLRRAVYDEELWLRGLSNRSKKVVHITPEWIKTEALKLRNHMAHIDSYRMNHAALGDYVVALLSDEHLSLLQDSSEDIRCSILDDILVSVAHLHANFSEQAEVRLTMLAGKNEEYRRKVEDWAKTRLLEARWNKYQPIIILTATALLCLFLWWLSQKR